MVNATNAEGRSDDAVLLVSSMVSARDESFQRTVEELKASTTRAVRAEMLDRILDGGALLSFDRPERESDHRIGST